MSDDPVTPDDLDAIRREYESGHKPALMRIIWICAVHQWILPEWARDALDTAHAQATSGRARSWDDVFGKPYTGQQRTRYNRGRRFEIWGAVKDRVVQGASITNKLFKEIGEDKGLSAKYVSNLYYEVEGIIPK